MYCKECGKLIDNDSKFCSYCGTKQSVDHNFEKHTQNAPESNSNRQNIDTSLSFGQHTKKELKETTLVEKYDKSYQGDSQATVLGILIIIINLIILFTVRIEDPYDLQVYKAVAAISNIIWRIIATIWVVNIAKRQNRDQAVWGIFAFLIPNLALIIIGLLKKLFKETYISADNVVEIDPKRVQNDIENQKPLSVKNSDGKNYSIIDTLVTKSWFQTQTEYIIEFSDKIKGSIYTFDSSIYFITHKDNSQFHYRTKESAIKALYLYLTKEKILMEDFAFSG